ncbi:hypothetical protein OB2597_10606 [Pseudooceanicola batsensis HTCC2597]|uniref:FAD dependent oxidoreductase domain-containing protein n=1 Tax=Pseudooceanicola batsensis (strain ATCC BAA-863 / DSM 15984 / KCTC 12145 / HTCC2597) TaxID=252305 RepID=A3TVP1_PSEBH|nr:FAD-dependent oxidoreductase [Pseudooceanicola batsensis]EAQ03687.1 hypothetical protein OB2597_10606 [Pseudooceanicola batsensis HTCC2597]
MKLAVIGAGLIGSAAARHLARQGRDVTLIGPGEPADKTAHDGVFASHYDEGRITRGLDPMPFWSRASRAAIARYAEIEEASGIRFYSEVGCLMAGPEGSPQVENMRAVAARDAIPCEEHDDASLSGRFPCFAFPPDTAALFEAKDAGHISPRALTRAQIVAATRAGARHIAAEVTGFDETAGGVRVTTAAETLTFDRILLATGGFSRLLLQDRLPIEVYARTVALFEIDAVETRRLAGMPSLIYLDPEGENPYLLPPIRYPDGRTYLKMGGDPEDVVLTTRQELADWFRSPGTPGVGAAIEAMIRDRMPGLRIERSATMSCVTTYTPDEHPHITALSDRVFTAIGGCGRAAKNSDELGRLGALRLTDQPLPDWAR